MSELKIQNPEYYIPEILVEQTFCLELGGIINRIRNSDRKMQPSKKSLSIFSSIKKQKHD